MNLIRLDLQDQLRKFKLNKLVVGFFSLILFSCSFILLHQSIKFHSETILIISIVCLATGWWRLYDLHYINNCIKNLNSVAKAVDEIEKELSNYK